ncbi:MAG: YihA family ribosome biogenesis GTP-binding protein [Fretibacterium sp.]|nr:YihA family ribosome biogenesis GTP-binding protein [Fretibacterium sp.]
MAWRATVEATSFRTEQFPPDGTPEIAVVGRSNVGKSSLINALLGRKLAHVGSTPGKTRSINFYAVEAPLSFRLVDLPGFGYASRSKSERRQWSQLASAYVEGRRGLLLICHLVDFRHGLLENDRLLQEWLAAHGREALVVFTKADKVARGKRRSTLHQYVRAGLSSVDVPLITSATERAGLEELRTFIEKTLARATGGGAEPLEGPA